MWIPARHPRARPSWFAKRCACATREHLPAHAIVAELEQLKQRIRVLAVVDSLKHLHKGGRLPAAVALVGGALGVKPVLSVVDGQIKLADTARGRPGVCGNV